MCTLVVNGGELAPFMPQLHPALESALEHSLPTVRSQARAGIDSLVEGVGTRSMDDERPIEVADPPSPPSLFGRCLIPTFLIWQVADLIAARLSSACADFPPIVASYLGTIG